MHDNLLNLLLLGKSLNFESADFLGNVHPGWMTCVCYAIQSGLTYYLLLWELRILLLSGISDLRRGA